MWLKVAKNLPSIRLTGVIRVLAVQSLGRPGQVEDDQLGIVTSADNCFVQLNRGVHPSDICVLSGKKIYIKNTRGDVTIILRLKGIHMFVLHFLVVRIPGVCVVQLHLGNLLNLEEEI